MDALSFLATAVIILYIQICFALQVSGLKSITSKHLALASQIISFIYSLIPGKCVLNLLLVIFRGLMCLTFYFVEGLHNIWYSGCEHEVSFIQL
jgi:hypothetical protein